MSKAFTALIIPIGATGSPPRPDNTLPGGQGGRPDNTLPGSQPGIDNTLPGDLPRPEHPIWYPLPPGGIIDNTLPGEQPGIDNTLPVPPPTVDNTLPGSQPGIDNTLPPAGAWLPIYIWGPNDPRPGTGLPGEQPGIDNELPIPPPEPDAKVEWKVAWTPTTGWVSFAIVVPATPISTPSRGSRR